MIDFAPYRIVTETESTLALELPKGRRIFFFVYFRIFPFFLLLSAATFIALLLHEKEVRFLLVVMVITLLFVTVLLMLNVYVIRLELRKSMVIITKQYFLKGRQTKEITLTDGAQLRSLYVKGRHGRGEIYLLQPDEKKEILLPFPRINAAEIKLLHIGHACSKRLGVPYQPD